MIPNPSISILIAIHNRSADVSRRVSDSFDLPGNTPDEVVVVLDRPTAEARKGAIEAWACKPYPVRFVDIPGTPEWLCPARAFNMGLLDCHGEYVICLSSEVVLDENAITRIRERIARRPVILFGRCDDSGDLGPVVSGPNPMLLCGAQQPRCAPFIMAAPMWAMRTIEGWDLEFMAGFWYDDDDLCFRLARLGIPFLFDDSIHGVHLSHPRPVLDSPEGKAKIATNAALMRRKWNSEHPWVDAEKLSIRAPGRTMFILTDRIPMMDGYRSSFFQSRGN
jgi:GT2 family glycosyltransferase